jgi:hypothetical protein
VRQSGHRSASRAWHRMASSARRRSGRPYGAPGVTVNGVGGFYTSDRDDGPV